MTNIPPPDQEINNMPKATLKEHVAVSGTLFGSNIVVEQTCSCREATITQEEFDTYIKDKKPVLAVECPECRQTVYVNGVTV